MLKRLQEPKIEVGTTLNEPLLLQNHEHQEHQDQEQRKQQNDDFQELDREVFQQNEVVFKPKEKVLQDQLFEDHRPRFKRHQSSRSLQATQPMHRRTSLSDVLALNDDTVVLTSNGDEDTRAKLPRFMTSRYFKSLVLNTIS